MQSEKNHTHASANMIKLGFFVIICSSLIVFIGRWVWTIYLQPLGFSLLFLGALILVSVDLDLDNQMIDETVSAPARICNWHTQAFLFLIFGSGCLVVFDCPLYAVAIFPPLFGLARGFCMGYLLHEWTDLFGTEPVLRRIDWSKPTALCAMWGMLTFGICLGLRMVFYTTQFFSLAGTD